MPRTRNRNEADQPNRNEWFLNHTADIFNMKVALCHTRLETRRCQSLIRFWQPAWLR